MPYILLIEILNKLVNEKKCIQVYHHTTGFTDTIPFNHSITLPLKTFITDLIPDFIQINIDNDPDNSPGDITINLPSWANFDFSPGDTIEITTLHIENRTLLKIPPCPPTWKLKISRPEDPISIPQTYDNVIIH